MVAQHLPSLEHPLCKAVRPVGEESLNLLLRNSLVRLALKGLLGNLIYKAYYLKRSLLVLCSRFLNLRRHIVISKVALLRNFVEEPEGRLVGVGNHISIAFGKASWSMEAACVNRCEAGGCCIIHAKPDYAANNIGKPASGLSNHPVAGLLCCNGALVEVTLAIIFKVHRPPPVRQLESACSGIFAHI